MVLTVALFALGLGLKPTKKVNGVCKELLDGQGYATAVEVFEACSKADGECMAVQKDYKAPSCNQDRNKGKAYCLVYKACKGDEMAETNNSRQFFVKMYDPEAARAVSEGKQERKLGLWANCNSNSECASGNCDWKFDECAPAGYSRGVDGKAARDNGCLSSCLTNFPNSNFCYTQCGTHRSVADAVPEARLAGYEQNCNRDSDCQSNNCYSYHGRQGWCDRARAVDDRLAQVLGDFEEEERTERRGCPTRYCCCSYSNNCGGKCAGIGGRRLEMYPIE